MSGLEEGKEYKFLVEKEISLPDNSLHFVLAAPDSRKYLLPAARYSHYGISSGSFIWCRVDRINCRGEIFLEPRHPYYKEGRSYPFGVEETDFRADITGKKIRVIVVTDIYGDRLTAVHNVSEPLPANGSVMNFTIERITRGRVLIKQPARHSNVNLLKPGISYEFVIESISLGLDDEEYFIIKDPFGDLHAIRKQYYEYYGFSTGTKFQGKIVRYRDNGEKTIEPENPYYKPGDILDMEIADFSGNSVNQSFTINLMDKFGISHCITSDSAPAGNLVRCRVIKIRKGKPLLELL